MARPFLAYPLPELASDHVAIRPASARQLGLLPGERVWLSPPTGKRHLLRRWSSDARSGPDGCFLSPELFAQLGLTGDNQVLLERAHLPQPSFYALAWTCDDADSEPGAEDLIVVLDTSGSMAGKPLLAARQGLLSFVDRWRQRSPESPRRLGLVTFGGDGEAGVQVACPLAEGNEAAFLSALEDCAAEGLTPLGPALARAASALGESEALVSEVRRRLLVVSDGIPCPSDDSLTQRVDDLGRAGIRVAAVGVGDHFDRHLLLLLAARTQGIFVEAHRMAELVAELEALA